ncbi:GGDEF domain-containing protein [Ramlibacter sp.]|uniref:GGDEF domain-containing protein n=1 Tax=Ramlibacter sp. TaxID=1917967 RepID=UPI002610BC39|nr:GGDEF domain-containing protein [Ramlibacter sp.]MDB5956337.1 putative rane protein [Ramlibacter sp.]
MDPIAAGFWGAFFGTAALMLGISLAVFVRTRRQVALSAAFSAVVCAVFVAACLGWLSANSVHQDRLVALIAPLSAGALSPMLLALLGLLRQRRPTLRVASITMALALAVVAAGWMLAARQALILGWAATLTAAVVMLLVAIRTAWVGSRLAAGAAVGMALLLVGLSCLSWIGIDHSTSWPVHAVSALACMGFLSVMGAAAWDRYSYLLELSEVMAHGPAYDPVTRMRSHSETGQMVGDMFFHRDAEARPVGVVAVCIGNLYALENLHGRAAFNHALFICAGRLRRCVPQTVEMGRLGEDGFLLLTRSMEDMRALGQLARQIRERLARPVSLSTSRDPGRIGTTGTNWVADIGIGVLATSTKVRPAQVVATVRAMARTAWTYPTRVAVFDQEAGQIAELAVDETPLSVF